MRFPPVIILIGFMGAGKTSTGKDLAKALRFDFLDTDQWIEERNNKKIAQIFKDDGESFFRSEEKEAINWIRNHSKSVISTGGGLWINEENRNQLLSLGWCVWLEVSPEVAWKRVKPYLEQRPLLAQESDPLVKIEKMEEVRNPLYQLAHARFLTDNKDSKKVADDILSLLKKDSLIDFS
jgi:shikimate kinase